MDPAESHTIVRLRTAGDFFNHLAQIKDDSDAVAHFTAAWLTELVKQAFGTKCTGFLGPENCISDGTWAYDSEASLAADTIEEIFTVCDTLSCEEFGGVLPPLTFEKRKFETLSDMLEGCSRKTASRLLHEVWFTTSVRVLLWKKDNLFLNEPCLFTWGVITDDGNLKMTLNNPTGTKAIIYMESENDASIKVCLLDKNGRTVECEAVEADPQAVKPSYK